MSQLFGGATANALKGVLDEILEQERQMPKWYQRRLKPIDDNYEMQMVGIPYVGNATTLHLQNVGAGTVTVADSPSIAIGDVRGPLYRDGVATTAPLELNDGRVFEYNPATLAWALLDGPALPAAQKPRVCTCGGKFAGGTHSHWCDLND